MSVNLALPDDWRTWDPQSKDRLTWRLKAEAIIKRKAKTFCTDATPSALAARLLGDRWHHRNYHDVLDRLALDLDSGEVKMATLSMPPQTGKALALDTLIATPDGWTTMGQLRPGDQVFDDQGKPCTVTSVSPVWIDRECYEVVADGENSERIIASREHEWVAKLDSRRSARVVETHVLARPRAKNAQISACPGLELPDAVLPMDPYTFGAWLGDGHTNGNRITTADTEILERIAEAGYQSSPIKNQAGGKALTYRLYHKDQDTRQLTRFVTELKAAVGGSQVKGRRKFIPVQYLRASRAQRLALLQGLVDTDGYVDPRGGVVEFCTTTEQLAHDVCHLVWTLGAKATVRKGRATLNGVDCGPKYRVGFMLADAAWVPRKRERCKDSSVAGVRYVYARKVETVPTVCIEVDSPSHMFLAGRSLVPTHNSSWVNWFVFWWNARHPEDPIIRMSYAASLASKHGRSVQDFVTEYGGQFGLIPKRGAWAQNEWETRTGAALRSGGMLTGVTGYPAALMLLDDPLSGRSQADSQLMRDKVWEEYSGSLVSRMRPGAPLLMVATRWHSDDPIGRLIAQHGDEKTGGKVRVINLPAIAGADDILGRAEGEPLQHPWIDPEDTDAALRHWEDKRLSSSLRDWFALYMGDPKPVAGALLTEQQVKAATWTGDLPKFSRTAVGVDPSGGGRDVAGVVACGVTEDGVVIWTHDRSERMSSEAWATTACLLAHEIDANEIVYEFNYGGDQAKFLIRSIWNGLVADGTIEDRPCPRIVAVKAKKNKRVRAEPIAVQVNLGHIKFHGLFVLDLGAEWQTWQESSNESPGRIDASSYLAYRYLKIPGAESNVSTVNLAETRKESTGQGALASQRVNRPAAGR